MIDAPPVAKISRDALRTVDRRLDQGEVGTMGAVAHPICNSVAFLPVEGDLWLPGMVGARDRLCEPLRVLPNKA